MQNNEYNKRNDNSGYTTTIYDKYDSNNKNSGNIEDIGLKKCYLTLLRMGLSGAAYGWEAKSPPP